MDAGIVISRLIVKLQNPLLDEAAFGDPMLRSLVTEAINELNKFAGFLEYKEAADHLMDDQWMARLLHAVYCAEDATDTLFMETALQRQRQGQKDAQSLTKKKKDAQSSCWKLCRPAICRPSLDSPSLFTDKMKKLMKEVKDLSEAAGWSFPIDQGCTQQQHWGRISGSCLDQDTDFVGFEEQVRKLVALLIPTGQTEDDGKDYRVRVISVVGERGSGKTNLVKTVYNTNGIKQYFRRAWVHVPKEFKASIDVLAAISRQFAMTDREPLLEGEFPSAGLQEILKNDDCLIVMDDFGTPEILEGLLDTLFHKLESPFYSCRMIITTRNADVAKYVSSIPVLRPKADNITGITLQISQLNNEESQALFLKKVHIPKDSLTNSPLIELIDKILEICSGVPLAIVLIGGLLSTKELNHHTWSKMIEQVKNIEDILALSYRDLPSWIKPCFLYMGIFSRAFEVPVRRLIQLWLAEGFVTPSHPEEIVLEDLAEMYLEELIRRNMIQVVRWRLNGRPKTCRMQSALYDLFATKAVDMGFFHIHRNSEYAPTDQTQFAVRRLASYTSIKNYPSSELCTQHLRSYVSFNTRKVSTQATSERGKFLNKIILMRDFGLLEVLDLEGVYKPRLPETLGKLLLLKYLGLRSTYLDSLPVSIGELSLLETLDVKQTNITTLPHSIWKAKNLRHLYMNWVHLEMSFEETSWSLSKLQTLWGLSIGNESLIVHGLNEIIGIRKLGLACRSTSALDAIANWISTLTKLEFLRLRTIDNSIQPLKLKLNNMADHHELLDLYLVGVLPPTAINVQFFPPNLKVLTLSLSRLEYDPMPTLGQLPHLNTLRLLGGSYVGEVMTCGRGGFCELRVLKLWKLSQLNEWNVERGAMPRLSLVEIRDCFNMKKPDRLLEITTLEELILINMKWVTEYSRNYRWYRSLE